MSRGRKAPVVVEFCTNYHCPGDCGKSGHGAQHKQRYADAVLDAWDRLFPEDAKKKVALGKSATLDTDPEVRRKARSAL